MADPIEELRAIAARLKRESDELVRKIDALSRSDLPPRHDAPLTEEQMLLIAQRAVALFEKQSPRPPQVNQKQAAEMLGVSARTMHNMIKVGTLRLNRCGLIPIDQIDLLLARSRGK